MTYEACREPPPPALLAGVAQFNRGEFFEQHETLELLWRAERREVRRLYQGILQIGVAFHHLRRLNHHGTVYMLTRGPRYLAPFAPACQTVDVARLIADAAAAHAQVERLGKDRLEEFDWALAPKVHFTADGVGLCRSCRFAESVQSSKGSEFWRCLRADEDPAFAKYPRLPVVQCSGYEFFLKNY